MSEANKDVIELWQLIYDYHKGDLEKAHRWVLKPKLALGNKAPLSFMSSTEGIARIVNLINQLEHGFTA